MGDLAGWNHIVPDTRYIFQKPRLFSNKSIYLGSSGSTLFLIQRCLLSLCFHIDNSLQMKRCQGNFLLPKQIFLHLYIKIGLSRICKKSFLNCWFIVRDGVESIVHHLKDFPLLLLYLRVIVRDLTSTRD